MRSWAAIAVLLFALKVSALPVWELSPDGQWFRINNPDPVSYYCWIDFGNGEGFNGMLYPGQATPWYRTGPRVTWGFRG